MSTESNDAMKRDIVKYFSRLADLQKVSSLVERLTKSVRLIEEIIYEHFRPEMTDGEQRNFSLGDYLAHRSEFLGEEIGRMARKVTWIRNRESHYHSDGPPSDDERMEAIEFLDKIVRKHLSLLMEQNRLSPADLVEPQRTPVKPANRFSIQESSATDSTASRLANRIDRNVAAIPEAGTDDPTVSATTLAEYTFCPRAGILTHENSYSDPEEEIPSLSLLPWYEKDAIEEAYGRSVYELFWLLVAFVVGLVVLSILPLPKLAYLLLMFVGATAWLHFTKNALVSWRELGKRRLSIRIAVQCDPNPNKLVPQPVDWFGLLLAGYEVRRPEDVLRDEKRKLVGKPRRILQKGGMSIPVHRINKTDGKILPQHVVRVIAHCHLVEATEGTHCPFAIILFGNTYKGITVPNTVGNREHFYKVLKRVRDMINDSKAGERQPPAPAVSSICRECPHGRPRPASEGDKTMRYNEPLDPYLLVNGRGTLFHCDCGDRFRWKPEHRANQRLQRPS